MDRKIKKRAKLEQVIDLGLVNFVPHPTDPDYMVFRFADIKRAQDFEKRLTAAKIWFEKGENPSRSKDKVFHLYGVHHRDYKAALQINYDVEASNRNFILKNNILRWSLLIFTFGILALAVFGYCSRKDTVISQNLIHNVGNE